jgi:predicted class III extradiol MEMO1 family dioxygenase
LGHPCLLPLQVMTVEADEDEHSIEMQLPFIAKVRQY